MTPTDKDHATARAIVAPIAELLLDGDAATADLIAAAIAEARRETAEACAVAGLTHAYPTMSADVARETVKYASDPEGDSMPVIVLARAILNAEVK